jgi:hypothetical protein
MTVNIPVLCENDELLLLLFIHYLFTEVPQYLTYE